jgi:hypothetical protein
LNQAESSHIPFFHCNRMQFLADSSVSFTSIEIRMIVLGQKKTKESRTANRETAAVHLCLSTFVKFYQVLISRDRSY